MDIRDSPWAQANFRGPMGRIVAEERQEVFGGVVQGLEGWKERASEWCQGVALWRNGGNRMMEWKCGEIWWHSPDGQRTGAE